MAFKVDYIKIRERTVKFGKNNFIEIARMKAEGKEGTTEYVSISRGFFRTDGTKKYLKSISMPDTTEIKDFVGNNIRSI